MDEAIAFTCDVHVDAFDCPDTLVTYLPKFDEYEIIIHDGGTSGVLINFCPWCGSKLPDSKRDLWFDTLEKLGFVDPLEETIPSEFNTKEWYASGKYL